MAVKVGSFTSNTATGNQAITGLGFAPDYVFFTATLMTSAGTSTSDGSIMFGYAGDIGLLRAGTQGWWELDAPTGLGQTAHHAKVSGSFTGSCLSIISSYTTTERATIVSLDSDGFTINWATAPAAARLVYYLAITFEDATDGYVTPSTVIGNTATITTTWAPTLLFMLMNHPIGSSSPNAHAGFHVGAATSASDRAFTLGVSGDGSLGARVEASEQLATAVQGTVSNYPSATISGLVDVSSFDSGGITLVTDATLPSTQTMPWLAVKTQAAKVGVETQKTSTGTKSVTGLGFQPDALIVVSFGQPANASPDSNANMTVGFSDGTTSSSTWAGGVTGSNRAAVGCASSSTKALMFIDTPGSIVAEAACTLDSDGFTMDWTTADGVARQFVYIAMQSYGFVPPGAFIPHIYRRL